MTIRQSDILCCYDFTTTFVGTGGIVFLKDFGPNRCDLPLTGAGCPNPPAPWSGPDGAGMTFDGTNDALIFPVDAASRFWSAIPNGHTDLCFVGKAFWRAPAVNDNIFGAINAAGTLNFSFKLRAASAERINVQTFVAAGACNYGDGGDVPLTGRTRTFIHSARFRPGAAPLIFWRLYDGGTVSASAYTSLTDVPLAWDTATQPRIGSAAAGVNFHDGRMYHLAVLKAIPTTDEATEVNSIFEHGRKPWCA